MTSWWLVAAWFAAGILVLVGGLTYEARRPDPDYFLWLAGCWLIVLAWPVVLVCVFVLVPLLVGLTRLAEKIAGRTAEAQR